MTVRVATEVDASLSRVFTFMSDFPVLARVLHSATETYFVGDSTTGLGAEWLQRAPAHGEGMIEARHRIVAFDPPRGFTMETVDASAVETMEFVLTDVGGRTRIDFTVRARAATLWLTLFAWLGRGFIRRSMQEDLERLRDTIEGELPLPEM
ncbi:MAG: SRPBCC family protein [Armatimonadota bacterium]